MASDTPSYQQRLAQFMEDMHRVSQLEPQDKYLFPILDTPVFSDLQTALMMADIKYRACENRK